MKKICALILCCTLACFTLVGCLAPSQSSESDSQSTSAITPDTPSDDEPILLSPITNGGTFNANDYFDDSEEGSETDTSIILKTRYNGGAISVISETTKNYLSLTDENDIARFLYEYNTHFTPANSCSPVEFNWRCKNPTIYDFYLSTDENFENIVYQKRTSSSSLSVMNLIPDKYYWKVVSIGGSASEIDSFIISDSLRTINCGNVANMRDEGGWIGEFGKIKYELAYRSADIAKANSEAVSVLKKNLKLKTEIDLRLDTTTVTVDDSITKVNCGILQNDYIFPDFNSNRPFNSNCAKNMKKAFMLFTDINNYPIVFHCSAGADRTGTFSFLLCGMLGVSYEDMVKDFEITSFYKGARWRSIIRNNNGEYYFDESGVMEDDAGNLIAFEKMYRQMMTAYGTGDGKLSSAIENYLITVIGLTKDNIETIRSIMFENYNAE